MKLVITIDADNAAFEGDNLGNECADILWRLAGKLVDTDRATIEDRSPIPILDSNGNRVGRCEAIAD